MKIAGSRLLHCHVINVLTRAYEGGGVPSWKNPSDNLTLVGVPPIILVTDFSTPQVQTLAIK